MSSSTIRNLSVATFTCYKRQTLENGTAEGQEEAKSPSVEETAEIAKIEEAPELTPSKLVNSVQDAMGEVAEKTKEMVTAVKSSADDLPPPLPASPPPSEPVGAKLSDDISNTASELLGSFSGKLDDVTSSVSNTFTETIESTGEIIKDAEQIAIETGKQIEEKATSLLKTVEKRAEESLKTVSQTIDDTVGMMENALHLGEKVAAEKETEMQTSTEDASKSLPTDALATKMDETAEKVNVVNGNLPVELAARVEGKTQAKDLYDM
ncbi:hypothetical protein RUM44_012088 [Polyplax serrata]|uniref:Uncharacterized protein n=1 Tax=Polyplax serrata TaxID=468196 RepID=A0ABR1BAB0_POLSC